MEISDATQREIHELIDSTKEEMALLQRVSHLLTVDERIILKQKPDAIASLERIDNAREWVDASLQLRRDVLGLFYAALAERIASDNCGS